MKIKELREQLELLDGETDITVIFNHEPFDIDKIELDPYYESYEFHDIPLCIKVKE